jgi:hypothetical protein
MNSTQRIARRPLAVAVALVFGTVGAQAATITVTDGGDGGTGTTCTLRQAISSASNGNSTGSGCIAGTGTDTIMFAPALANSTITLTQGQLSIRNGNAGVAETLTITGSGQTIVASTNSRVMGIYSASSYAFTDTLSGLTLTGGSSNYGGGGGGIFIGNGASRPSERGHKAPNASAALIAPTNSVTLSNVTVNNNTATIRAGGIYVNGTALTLDQSTVSGNTLAATNNYGAGGIYATNNSTVTISNSTISGNSATGSVSYLAGGIYAYHSSATLTNTSITGNTANGQNYLAGGIEANTGTNPFALNDCTVSGNSATTTNASTYVAGGALVGVDGSGTLILANTILSGNTGLNPDLYVSSGTTTANFSLLGTAATGFPSSNNVSSDAPGLGALANNGGPTQTMALQAGSPAIGVGSVALIPAGVTTDQRGTGFARVVGGKVDIGAFQSQPAAAVVTTPTPMLSTWALTLLGGLLAWFGLARKRQSL